MTTTTGTTPMTTPGTVTWQAYLADSYGFVLADPEGILALIEDEEAIWREYGDCIPSEIVVARGEAAPKPQSPGSTSLRLPGSYSVMDHVSWDIGGETAGRALLIWKGAQGFAAALNVNPETKCGSHGDSAGDAPRCHECGHLVAAHRFYSRCEGTLAQPQCSCLLTPSDLESAETDRRR